LSIETIKVADDYQYIEHIWSCYIDILEDNTYNKNRSELKLHQTFMSSWWFRASL